MSCEKHGWQGTSDSSTCRREIEQRGEIQAFFGLILFAMSGGASSAHADARDQAANNALDRADEYMKQCEERGVGFWEKGRY